MPRCFSALSRPAYAASLKLLSPRPPMSNTSPTSRGWPSAGVDDEDFGPLPHPASSDAARATAASPSTVLRRRMRISRGGREGGVRPATEFEATTAAGFVQVGAADHDAAAAR